MDLSFFSGLFASPWNIIRTLIDIGVVAYLIYRLIWLIRDTRAEQLLKGVVILVLFSAVVSYLKLELLGWLLDKAWLIFAIALPIVFQPELRRLLEQLGQRRFFSGPSTWTEREMLQRVIREVEEAVSRMSERHVGALIIFERDTLIDEFLDSGSLINADVSAALLVNIFEPKTPLHDGAVVIKNGKLSRAACFLPLSINPTIDPQMGTRHRAAIGITELTDALAVVVSEETGSISLVRSGKITRYLDHTLLGTKLENELLSQEEGEESSWVRRILNGNRKEKNSV